MVSLFFFLFLWGRGWNSFFFSPSLGNAVKEAAKRAWDALKRGLFALVKALLDAFWMNRAWFNAYVLRALTIQFHNTTSLWSFLFYYCNMFVVTLEALRILVRWVEEYLSVWGRTNTIGASTWTWRILLKSSKALEEWFGMLFARSRNGSNGYEIFLFPLLFFPFATSLLSFFSSFSIKWVEWTSLVDPGYFSSFGTHRPTDISSMSKKLQESCFFINVHIFAPLSIEFLSTNALRRPRKSISSISGNKESGDHYQPPHATENQVVQALKQNSVSE